MNGWLMQSLIAMLLLVPAWISIGFFDRNFQVKSDIFLIWYFMGAAIASACLNGLSYEKIVPSCKLASVMMLIGLTFGSAANILLFRAVVIAPNPGLPVAIANVASVGVFLVSLLLCRWLPSYFSTVKIDKWSLLGVGLTIIGSAIIATRR